MTDGARQRRLGKNIKELREERRLTQDELAARVGFTTGAVIAAIEAGTKTPGLWKALDMAQQFGVSLSQLIGETVVAGAAVAVPGANSATAQHQTVYQYGRLTTETGEPIEVMLTRALDQALTQHRTAMLHLWTSQEMQTLLVAVLRLAQYSSPDPPPAP